MVEKYLVDAHNNFLNSPNTKSHQLVITSQNENDQDEIQEKNYNTDNSSEATEEMFPAQKAGKFVQSSYIKLFNFSKEHVPKGDHFCCCLTYFTLEIKA